MPATISNRDLSWLSFNERVLQEAQDQSVPLIQRLRFLGIFSNNQDEFIKVRVANIIRFARMREKKVTKFSGGYDPRDLLPLVNTKVLNAQNKFMEIYASLLAEMEQEGIFIINERQLTPKQKQFCRDYFSSVVSQHLVPLIIRKTTQMPFLRDNQVYLGVKMSIGKKNVRYAIIQIPVTHTCPRFVVLPSEEGRNDIIFLDDILRLCLDEIFFMFNYTHISAYTFKFMRDALLTIDDDISKSLIEKMEDGIQNRLHGSPVRLVYDREMPEDLLKMIAGKLKLRDKDTLEAGGRYHLLRDLMKFPSIRPDLENRNPVPLAHPAIQPNASLLKVIQKKDILLNYPYHTFTHFIDFLREAAIDPNVETICITLYRTAESSKVINALVNAAKNGKQVVVLLELLARFDEEQNVEYSELLQREGVKVIHGIAGLKVHSKLVLVERKVKSRIQGFAYIGTGNFNESTARIYGDFGLFTAHPQLVADAREVFDFLINTHKHFYCKELMVSPYFMRNRFEELIAKEIRFAAKGRKSYIYAKFNSLTDERMIRQLYKASQAGVEIRLIIRGACILQPGIPGLSENIRVISIVDKYLEHARLAIFHHSGEDKTFIMSADWMTRNLDRRVEVCTPVYDKEIKQTLKHFFQIQWSDNVKARIQNKKGENCYVEQGDKKKCRSQEELYDFYKNGGKSIDED